MVTAFQAAAESLVVEEVEALQREGGELPPATTRPMREAVPA